MRLTRERERLGAISASICNNERKKTTDINAHEKADASSGLFPRHTSISLDRWMHNRRPDVQHELGAVCCTAVKECQEKKKALVD